MPKGFKHIDLNKRSQIFAFNATGMSTRKIAQQTKFHHSTISREMKKNRADGLYQPVQAEEMSKFRRSKASTRKSKITGELKDAIVNLLKQKLSPQQISGRLKLEGVANISHQSIYKFIWEDKEAGEDLWKFLRHNGKKYNKRKGVTAGRGFIKNRVDISERPDVVDTKERIGDWEIDTMVGQQTANQVIVTAVDRHSKYTVMRLAASKKAEDVSTALINGLLMFAHLVLTLTYDNGKEFAYHEKVAATLQALCFFATPYHSWERGLNEHTNGLIRQFFPKGMDFGTLTPEMVQSVENNLNHRPRKALGYRTPFEVFHNTKTILSGVAFRI